MRRRHSRSTRWTTSRRVRTARPGGALGERPAARRAGRGRTGRRGRGAAAARGPAHPLPLPASAAVAAGARHVPRRIREASPTPTGFRLVDDEGGGYDVGFVIGPMARYCACGGCSRPRSSQCRRRRAGASCRSRGTRRREPWCELPGRAPGLHSPGISAGRDGVGRVCHLEHGVARGALETVLLEHIAEAGASADHPAYGHPIPLAAGGGTTGRRSASAARVGRCAATRPGWWTRSRERGSTTPSLGELAARRVARGGHARGVSGPARRGRAAESDRAPLREPVLTVTGCPSAR